MSLFCHLTFTNYIKCDKYEYSLWNNKTAITKTMKTNVIVYHNYVYHKNVFLSSTIKLQHTFILFFKGYFFPETPLH